MTVSKSQIDKLGERLKSGEITERDIEELEEYRRSFASAHDLVIATISDRLGLQPSGRRAKVTASIVDKLRRESIRLTQIQDIAGCRLVVDDVARQDRVVESLQRLFADSVTVDRRGSPSHGYRAVHIIIRVERKPVEVQVRTQLQHEWAELSEKLSDAVDPDIKYGGGPIDLRQMMDDLSTIIAGLEADEAGISEWRGDPLEEWVREDTQYRREDLLALLERLAAGVRLMRE